MLRCHSLSGGGRSCVAVDSDHNGGQYIDNIPWCTQVNISQLSLAYLNATNDEKPKMLNRILETTGRHKHGKTRGSTGTGQGLDHQVSAGQVFGRVWNWTNPYVRSQPRPLAGSANPFLTLVPTTEQMNRQILKLEFWAIVLCIWYHHMRMAPQGDVTSYNHSCMKTIAKGNLWHYQSGNLAALNNHVSNKNSVIVCVSRQAWPEDPTVTSLHCSTNEKKQALAAIHSQTLPAKNNSK